MRKKETLRVVFWLLSFFVLFGVHNFLALSRAVIENRGISFSFLKGGVLYLTTGVWLFVFFYFRKTEFLGIKLILLAGAINLLDRFMFGAVRDYFLFFAGVYNNIADWLIGFAIFVFILELWRKKLK